MDNKERIEFIKELELKKKIQDSSKKKKKLLIVFFVSLFILSFTFFIYFIFYPSLTLKGTEKQTIKYLQKYQEKGYQAFLYGKDISAKVKVQGSVDTKKLGTYTIKYSVKNGFLTTKKKRIVKVVDSEKPILLLKGSEKASVCPNREYTEEGYEATDNYDGDITNKVKITKKENKITYSIEDSSHNKTEIKREIIHQDIEKPILTLIGANPTYVPLGSSYQEPGHTAIDNCSGDITKEVVVEGSVDTSKAGTYYLTYKVKDTSENEQTITRSVVVYKKNTSGGSNTPGTIYLTFDDGPGTPTNQILNILKEEGVKATFFVTSNGADNMIARAYREGHTIGLHTYTHNYASVYASVNAYFDDLNKIQNRVENITGYKATAIRFPGGSSNTISKRYKIGIMATLTREVVARGYRYYDWNVDSEDAGKCAKDVSSFCVYNHVVTSLSKRRSNMVLMHDTKSYTADALRDIIRYGKENGYTFLPIKANTPMVKHGVNN